MNRRTLITATAFASLPFVATAETTGQSDVMTMFIEEVIRDGDMSSLANIVTEDVVVARLGVNSRDEFKEVSLDGYEARMSEFSSLDMEIESLAENGEWCHAFVRAIGQLRAGRKQNLTLFYVARFRDGLISHLYFG